MVDKDSSLVDLSVVVPVGADDYLGKPYKSDQILAAVKRFTR